MVEFSPHGGPHGETTIMSMSGSAGPSGKTYVQRPPVWKSYETATRSLLLFLVYSDLRYRFSPPSSGGYVAVNEVA